MTDYKKLYEEALERAKYWAEGKCMNDFYDSPQNVLNFVFPETKESEGERIRKFLIKCVQQPMGTNLLNGIKKDDVIAWLEKQGKNNMGISEATKQELEDNLNKSLEKETPESWNKFLDEQGEQQPIDKVEPKFNVGDKINMINREEEDYTILTITSINMDEKCYICNQGSVIDFDEEREWYKIEPKPTWSEEDEVAWNNTTIMIKECAANHYAQDSINLVVTWLKSLKDRMALTNKNDFDRGYDVGISAAKFNQWKPTEEQMKVLKDAAFDAGYEQHFKEEDVLESLIEDLKKL